MTRAAVRAWPLVVIGSVALAQPRSVQAADKEACIDAHEQGQRLRRDGRLAEARAAFVLCSSEECPQILHAECAENLAKVENEQPSIVIEVHDAEGRDVAQTTVTIDDSATATLDGRPLPLDPGKHVVRAKRAGGAVREQEILLVVGEKNRKVTLTFTPSAPPPKAVPMAAPIPVAPPSDRSLGAPFWLTAGVGVLGFASFGTFAALGKATELCKGSCTKDEVDRLRLDYAVADISLAVGVVATGLATVLFFTSTAPSKPAAARAAFATW